jgi:putative ATP-dependent endonuclease of OLD family
MRILRVDIENFRGISSGCVVFPGHALLVGPNNACKSTVLEALDLALGSERGSGPNAVDEHDFHRGVYGLTAPDAEGQARPAPTVAIIVTLGSLTQAELVRFRSHVELWNNANGRPCTPEEADAQTPTLDGYVLRVKFNASYDPDEDEFATQTVYLNPEGPEQSFDTVSKSDKRAIGFLYLRSLRTARRAASWRCPGSVDT